MEETTKILKAEAWTKFMTVVLCVRSMRNGGMCELYLI